MAKPKSTAKLSCSQVMAELEDLGSEGTRRVLKNHGAPDAMFGVRVADLKKILKRTGPDHALALELWDTGNADAQYLAGLMAVPAEMSAKDLDRWAKTATWQMVAEYSVAGVAAESPHGAACARKWIDAKPERIAAAGWSTFAGVVSITPDSELDLKEIERLMQRIEKTIRSEQNRVRYTMIAFLIAVGGSVAPLSKRAVAVAEKIGKVDVDVGGTACKVPYAPDYIAKVLARYGAPQKRKSVRC